MTSRITYSLSKLLYKGVLGITTVLVESASQFYNKDGLSSTVCSRFHLNSFHRSQRLESQVKARGVIPTTWSHSGLWLPIYPGKWVSNSPIGLEISRELQSHINAFGKGLRQSGWFTQELSDDSFSMATPELLQFSRSISELPGNMF